MRARKAHRLSVEQGAGEHRRVVVFDPGGDVDQLGKTGGVAFRKAVFAKALNLVEATLGEVTLIAALDHAFDHHLFELVDRADMAKRCHGTAQAVGLFGAELCSHHGDLHRLLLKQRHPKRTPEHMP